MTGLNMAMKNRSQTNVHESQNSGDLVKIEQVEQVEQLCSPMSDEVIGRQQAGEEEQDWEDFQKTDLVFPSGEELPLCWMDESYQLASASAHSREDHV